MADPVRGWLGIDSFGLVVHVGVTICLMGFVAMSNGPDELFPVLTAASLLALAGRRTLAQRRRVESGEITGEVPPAAVRIADLEHRVAELEAVHERVAELEERLDFSERVLAQGHSPEPQRVEGMR